MTELEERINAVLGDPAQLEGITRLARSLMGGGGQEENMEEGGTASFQPSPGMLGQLGIDGETMGRISRLLSAQQQSVGAGQAMLEAMRPYLSEKRQHKVDKALKIARLAKLAGLAMGEMEVDSND